MSTISSYVGDGSTSQFDITFLYSDAASVKVRVDGVDVSYTFINPSRIQTTTAPAAASLVEVYRKTSVYPAVVDFTDGAIVLADDLDASVGQPRNRVEELESEIAALGSRFVKMPGAEAAVTLPTSSARSGQFLAFDGTGKPVPSPGSDGIGGAVSVALAATSGASLVGYTNTGGTPAVRTLQAKLREGRYSTGDYSVLPTITTPEGWYWDYTNPDGAGGAQLRCSIPNTVSMAGGAGVQGVGLIFNGSTSAATPNSGLAETNMIRMNYVVNGAAGQKLQVHLINGALTVNHDVGSSGNEGAVLLGTMRANGPAVGGSNVAMGLWGADVHVEKPAGVASGKMVGLEVGVHAATSQTYGTVADRQNGIELWSGDRSGITGAKAHNALDIFGTGGWTNFIRCRHTDNTTEVFKVDGAGNLTLTGTTGDIAAVFQVNSNNTSGTLEVSGRSAGGSPVNFVAQSQAGGQVNIGSTTNHPLVVTQNNVEIFRVVSAGINLASGKVLQVAGTQVLQARDTGWTAMTGSSDKATALATGTVTLAQLAGRVMALQAALTTHGLLGA